MSFDNWDDDDEDTFILSEDEWNMLLELLADSDEL